MLQCILALISHIRLPNSQNLPPGPGKASGASLAAAIAGLGKPLGELVKIVPATALGKFSEFIRNGV
jgi:hypothetical protein